MSTPDWSKAPEGATHWGPRHSEDCRGAWFRLDCDGWLVWKDIAWSLGPAVDSGVYAKMVARPVQWRGPQDGLPPVGTEVWAKIERKLFGSEVAMLAKVIATCGAWAWCSVDDAELHTVLIEKLAPIQSDRDRAIEEMKDIVCGNITIPAGHLERTRQIAYVLYDAGYRKVQP